MRVVDNEGVQTRRCAKDTRIIKSDTVTSNDLRPGGQLGERGAVTEATPSRVLYNNPPVVEVICQVTFADAVPWSVATPGVLYKALEDEYPADPSAMGGMTTSFNGGAGEFQIEQHVPRIVFGNREGTRRVVANNTCLSANALPPYEQWPNVIARFERALTTFRGAVADFTPASLSLRYINMVVIPEPTVAVSDYFSIPIMPSHQEDSAIQGFITRAQMKLERRGVDLTVTFANNDAREGECAFLLDIEVAAPIVGDPSVEQLIDTVEVLHGIENVEFESSITPKCRELFK